MNEQILRQLALDRRRELERDAHAARLAGPTRAAGGSSRADRATTAMLGLALATRRFRTS